MVFVALALEAVAAVLVAGGLAAWSRHHFTPRVAEAGEAGDNLEAVGR